MWHLFKPQTYKSLFNEAAVWKNFYVNFLKSINPWASGNKMQIKTVNQGSKKNHFSLFEYSRLKILKMVARCKILLGKKEGNFVQY